MAEDLLRFALLGLGAAGVYGLLALGIVLVYRGSGVVNFAGGAFALVGAAVFMEFRPHLGTVAAIVLAVAASSLLGAAVQVLLLHPMRRAAPLTRVVATLGVLVAMEQAAKNRYGAASRFVEPFLPQTGVDFGDVVVGADRLIILALTVGLAFTLSHLYRSTRFGLATTAMAENGRVAAALGWSPNLVAVANWALGGALSGAAGVLLVPLLGFAPNVFTLTVVPALAATVVAGFRSFPLAVAGAVLIGVLEAEGTYLQTRYPEGIFGFIPTVGLASSIPFLIMLLVMVVRGRALPLRGQATDPLPSIGAGIPRRPAVVLALVLTAGSLWVFTDTWNAAVISSTSVALVALSVVVVTGYAGQLSLVQFALAGLGAFFSSRLADAGGWPFPLAAAAGVFLTIVVGVVVALPAVRVRGVNLAVVTLGLAVVISAAVLANPDWNGGGIRGTRVPPPELFGVRIDSVHHPERWGLFCLAILTIAGLVVTNVRRGRSGRRLIAVRENERAAASLGVDVVGAKLVAFAFGAALAGAGGVLLAFRNVAVSFDQYGVFESVEIILLTVIGGLGYVTGALVAGAGILSGVVHQVLNHLWHVGGTFQLILALLFLVAVVLHPDGFAERAAHVLGRRSAHSRQPVPPPPPAGTVPPAPAGDTYVPAQRVESKTLDVRNLTVRFGSQPAVDDLSFAVRPGEVVGLIGPNGAGKTTVIDAVTGFLSAEGEILLGEVPLHRSAPARRVRAGVTRSFQSLELFADLSVADNLRVAADDGRARHAALDLVRTRSQPLSEAALAAVAAFRLEPVLDARPGALPYSRRRIVAIARAVATRPSVLLLDEPAAGLDSASRLELRRLVRSLADDWGMGILLVEHDLDVVMRTCDRVLVLESGRLLAAGRPEEVRRNDDVIAAYVGRARPVGTS